MATPASSGSLLSQQGRPRNPWAALPGREDLDKDRAQEETQQDERDDVEDDEELEGFEDINDHPDEPLQVTKHGVLSVRETDTLKIIKADAFPPAFRFTETGRQYERRTWPLTLHYEARDGPDNRKISTSQGRPTLLSERKPVLIAVRSYTIPGDAIGLWWAGSLKISGTGIRIFSSWGMQSQTPSLRIHVREDSTMKEATCHIFGNSIHRGADGEPSVEFRYGHSQEMKNLLPKDVPELGKAAYDEALFETALELFPDQAEFLPTGPPPARPVWSGISVAELNKIRTKLDQRDPNVSPFEMVVAYLLIARSMSVYRTWPNHSYNAAVYFDTWMSTAMSMVAQVEELWHFQLQVPSDTSIFMPEVTLGALEMARNIALDWTGQIDQYGNLVDAAPHRVVPYKFTAGEVVFSRAEILAFYLRLGVERNRAYQTYVLTQSLKQADWSIEGTFKAHKYRPGVYVIQMRLPDGSLLNADKTLRVKTDTRVEVRVKLHIVQEDPDAMEEDVPELTYFGTTCDDLFASGNEVVAVVRGPDLTDQIEKFESDLTFPICVKLVDDATPSDRHLATIVEIQRGLESMGRTTGVDIPQIVLRSPGTIQITDSLARQMDQDAEAIVNQVTAFATLDNEQANVLQNTVRSASGFTLVHGPPGTGKSRLLSAIAWAHLRIGKSQVSKISADRARRVIGCAPSNVATDKLMSLFLGLLQSHPDHGLEIVRYKGSLLKQDQRTTADDDDDAAMNVEQDDDATDDDRLEEAIWDLADETNYFGRVEKHADYGFYVQRKRKIETWAASLRTNSQHPMAKQSVEYLDVLEKVKNPRGLDKKQKKLNRARRHELEEDLNEYYLQNVVDIVFCTNSSSAHGVLRQFYRPKVLLSDEAASAVTPDVATPAGAFMHELHLWVMGGDHIQQKPVVASKARNEASSVLEMSLFQGAFEANMLENYKFQLVEQHRMNPQLSRPVGMIWYPRNDGSGQSSLLDHPSVLAPSPVWERFEEYLGGLGQAFPGHRRMIVDVSGDQIEAKPAEGTSWTNEVEAWAIANFIKKAIDFQGTRGQALTQANFLVLSPYKAQCHLITALLFRNGVNQKGLRVTCQSTRAVQGDDGDVVIISMVRRTKDQPQQIGFIGESGSNCVGNSRPKQALIQFGNFLAWRQAQIDGYRLFHPKNGKLDKFGQLIEDIWTEKDAVAWLDFYNWLEKGKPATSRAIDGQLQPPKPRRYGKGKGKAMGTAFGSSGPVMKTAFDLSEAARWKEQKGKQKFALPPKAKAAPLSEEAAPEKKKKRGSRGKRKPAGGGSSAGGDTAMG